MLRDDWLELTNRPWVAGSVDALLDNDCLTQLMAQHSGVVAELAAIVNNIDTVMRRVSDNESAARTAFASALSLLAAHNGALQVSCPLAGCSATSRLLLHLSPHRATALST